MDTQDTFSDSDGHADLESGGSSLGRVDSDSDTNADKAEVGVAFLDASHLSSTGKLIGDRWTRTAHSDTTEINIDTATATGADADEGTMHTGGMAAQGGTAALWPTTLSSTGMAVLITGSGAARRPS